MENINIDNLLNAADTRSKIDSVKGRNKALRHDIDLCARSAFLHAAEHGDLTLYSRLHTAVSNSFKADLKRYITTFGPVRYDVKSKSFVKTKKGGTWELEALDTPFDNFEAPEKAAAEYGRAKELASIVKFLDTKADRAVAAGDPEMCATLVDIAGVLAGLIK